MTTNINKFLDHTPPLHSQHQDNKNDDGSPETQGHSIDAHWRLEAESRLAAYRSGKVEAKPLEAVITKYQKWA